MIISFGLCILFGLFWLIFFTCRSFVNVILSWILSHFVKRIFPDANLQITVENFGYFSVNGIGVHINENSVVRIEQIVLQLLWEDFRLRLQSIVKEITLETNSSGKYNKQNKKYEKQDELVIKASITIGINLYSLHPPTELLGIVPEIEHAHGSDIKISELSSVWLFARNAKASIQDKLNDIVSCEILVSGADGLVLYNSYMARLVFLFKNASANCFPNTDGITSAQVAKSEGLILVYKFEDGILTSSHSRLKHTEVNLSALAISNLENLVSRYVNEHFDDSSQKDDVQDSCKNTELSSGKAAEEKCEMAIEAESVALSVYSIEPSKYFELKLAFICLSSPDINMTRWSVSIPFELSFIDELSGREKELILGSKINSDGFLNPCVLKLEGEKISNGIARWIVSFNEGILIEIKPKYVNTVESFLKTYKSRRFRQTSNSSLDVLEHNSNVAQAHDVIEENRVALNASSENLKRMCEISATISDITIDVKDKHEQKLLQVNMMHPKLLLSQDEETRSFSFMIETLKGFNCVENMPFFHPTKDSNEHNDSNEQEKKASLELFIIEKLSKDSNKLSFKKFSFGSCDTTVIVEETLIFAILKDFGLHKKVAQIFFQSREEQTADDSNRISQRFYFEHIELRDVEVILTLLPAIDLPVDLKVIKNSLGIPHQLPPRFENACLYFDTFVRKNIQYGSYKYISYDIKKHYLKELGCQSARVLGSMHLFGNISRLKQDIMSGFTTLRETGEFITFFHQVTTGVASSYSKFTGSWSDLFGLNSPSRSPQESLPNHERRHSDPSDLDVAVLRQFSEEFDEHYQVNSTPNPKSKDDCDVVDDGEDSESIWLRTSLVPDATNETDGLNWDTESSDGEGNLGFPFDSLIPRNVKRQLKGQEFLRRLKENLGDNEHGEVFSCCFKVRKNIAETKLNALLSNRKVYFLKGRPSHESLVLCVKYETLYKAQYLFQAKTHYIQLMNKMKGIKTLSIPSRDPGECPLVRCDNMAIGRKVSIKINELKRTYDHEYMHSQH